MKHSIQRKETNMDGLAKLKEDDLNAMLTPQEYFDAMKNKKNTVTSEDLKKIY